MTIADRKKKVRALLAEAREIIEAKKQPTLRAQQDISVFSEDEVAE